MASKKDKLTSAGIYDKFFSGPAPQEANTEEIEEKVSITPSKEEQPKKASQKPQKKMFAFRGEQSMIDEWRCYADAAGMKVEEFGTAAMMEYMQRHPLSSDQMKLFELKKKMKS
ncbi:MAG: hypothetical protein MJ097_02280 [Dorea sp.]|nr:hypothetical protein [Dorea sp.]